MAMNEARSNQAKMFEPEIARRHADGKQENTDEGGGDTRRYPALRRLVGKDHLYHAARATRWKRTAIERSCGTGPNAATPSA
jgi:hypothetical protein